VVMLTMASFSVLLLSTVGKLRSMNCAAHTSLGSMRTGERPAAARHAQRAPHRQRDSDVAGVVAEQQAADAGDKDERVNLRGAAFGFRGACARWLRRPSAPLATGLSAPWPRV